MDKNGIKKCKMDWMYKERLKALKWFKLLRCWRVDENVRDRFKM